jgi:tRNA(Arg) A34 adenosine deaminase TadA
VLLLGPTKERELIAVANCSRESGQAGTELRWDRAEIAEMSDATYPPRPSSGRLNDLWDSPVKDLVLLPAPTLSAPQVERHLLYCNLLMALLAHYWNGNKNGRSGTYPWREKQKGADGQFLGGDYFGHNIACIAVDGAGELIDFDFNHNEVLKSSVEHAEARLVRRVFELTQIFDGWAMSDLLCPAPPVPYTNILSDVTIYTSLESCAQCSGIMALGSVKEVVFLQRDPGQTSIGNILRALSPVGASFKAPLPIPANFLGLEEFEKLDQAYSAFVKELPDRPFHISPAGLKDVSPSITSFLCTDAAFEIFDAGRTRFQNTQALTYPDFKPSDHPKILSNSGVVENTKRFFAYAISDGNRGTPHNV